MSKVIGSIREAILASGLRDGMTIGFHHHLRSGDHVLNMVMEEIAALGIKDITINASSIFDTHAPLIDHMKNGVVTGLMTNYMGSLVGRAVSEGILRNPVIFHTHGSRAANLETGVDHIDVAFNSHPHDDHIDGFPHVDSYCPIGKMILTFEENYDSHMKKVVKYCKEQEIPIEHVGDGDVLTMGPNGEVTMRVIQRNDTGKWGANDRSAMLLIQYGERTILFTGDVENRAQKSYFTNVPEGGIKADILKYPHHGQVKLDDRFLEQIDPELAFMNGASGVMDGAKKYLKKHKIPYLIGYDGLTRMRTDGSIWVVDYLHEVETDRDTINPSYETTTDIP